MNHRKQTQQKNTNEPTTNPHPAHFKSITAPQINPNEPTLTPPRTLLE